MQAVPEPYFDVTEKSPQTEVRTPNLPVRPAVPPLTRAASTEMKLIEESQLVSR